MAKNFRDLDLGGDYYAVFMVVDVDQATTWLEKANNKNRRVKETSIPVLAQDVIDDNWLRNGSTIVISTEGNVLDGQHRLWAIVEAGKPIQSLVVFGADEAAFHKIDIGNKRTANDTLTIEEKISDQEIKYKSQISVAAKYHQKYLEDGLDGLLLSPAHVRVSNSDVLDVIRNCPDLQDSANFIGAFSFTAGLKKPQIIFLHMLMSRLDTAMANEFITKLFTGENLGKGSPILTLRNKLTQIRHTRGLINNHLVEVFTMAITIKAWNAFRSGKSAQVLSWGETEPPPTLK